jgi:hypothetical protein
MPVVSTQNAQTGRAFLRFSATETIVVAGNNSTSNLCASVAETVIGASITQLHYATSGSFTIARGANTICVLNGQNSLNLEMNGLALNEWPAANIVVTVVGTGTLFMEVHKQSTIVGA